jgi:hypothetical protein
MHHKDRRNFQQGKILAGEDNQGLLTDCRKQLELMNNPMPLFVAKVPF